MCEVPMLETLNMVSIEFPTLLIPHTFFSKNAIIKFNQKILR